MMGIKVHMVTEKKCWNEYNFDLMEWYLIKGKMKLSKLHNFQSADSTNDNLHWENLTLTEGSVSFQTIGARVCITPYLTFSEPIIDYCSGSL